MTDAVLKTIREWWPVFASVVGGLVATGILWGSAISRIERTEDKALLLTTQVEKLTIRVDSLVTSDNAQTLRLETQGETLRDVRNALTTMAMSLAEVREGVAVLRARGEMSIPPGRRVIE